MKLNSIALALVSAIALTACGGSGSNLSAVNNSDHADKSLNRGGSYNQGSYKQGSHSKDSHNQGSQSLGSQNQGSQNQGSQNQGSQNQGSQNQGSQNQGSQNQGSQNQGSQGQGSQGQGSQGQGSQGQGSQGQGSQGQGSQGQGSPTQQAQDDNPISQGDIKDNGSGYKGVYVAVAPENGEPVTLETKDFDTVIINGKEIKLEPLTGDGSSGNSYMLGSGDEDEVKLENVRYGYIYDDIASNGSHFFITQGFATPVNDMPTTTDVIKYSGNAVYLAEDEGRLQFAKSYLAVNFGRKELEGVIFNENSENTSDYFEFAFVPVIIRATIKGNQFIGDYNEVHTQGQFYGAKAAELAGTFLRDDKDNIASGAFGAKQKKVK